MGGACTAAEDRPSSEDECPGNSWSVIVSNPFEAPKSVPSIQEHRRYSRSVLYLVAHALHVSLVILFCRIRPHAVYGVNSDAISVGLILINNAFVILGVAQLRSMFMLRSKLILCADLFISFLVYWAIVSVFG